VLFRGCSNFGGRAESSGRPDASSSSEDGTSQLVSLGFVGNGRTVCAVATRTGGGRGERSTDALFCSSCQAVPTGFDLAGGLSSRSKVYEEGWREDLPYVVILRRWIAKPVIAAVVYGRGRFAKWCREGGIYWEEFMVVWVVAVRSDNDSPQGGAMLCGSRVEEGRRALGGIR
jgi:hypothetical protein